MNVLEWAEATWILPETGRPIVLAPWERVVLEAMHPLDGSPSPWETFLISCPKKGGKTTLDAIGTTYGAITFPAPELALVVANDELQAQERVFDLIAKWARASGLEASGAAIVTKREVLFTETGTRIVALSSDFAGSAGAVFGISSWTELWAFRYEAAHRLWEELTPIPNRRSLRIVDSYAGFTGDSPILEPMWERALKGERIHDELPIFANGRLWALIDQGEEAQRRVWRGTPEAMAAYYTEQAATLRPGTYARLHENRWQSSEEAFLLAADWDAITMDGLVPLEPGATDHRLYVGVDAATKSDSAAVVAVVKDGPRIRLARHRIWTPRKGQPLDLEETIEAYLLDLYRAFPLAEVRFDPYQMARSAATLRKAGLPMVEFPQTSGNLTAAGQALWELVKGRALAVYPTEDLRQHALNAVAVESGRGWRLAKEKSSRKIDGVVALSFGVLAAYEGRGALAATSHSYMPPTGGPVTYRGDLRLVGKQYVDRPTKSMADLGLS